MPTYDAKSLKVVDALDAGILDPTKVVTTALKNSSSVAGTVLTTESVIYSEKEKGEVNLNDPMMGM
jgi:chaperonin GroEL